MIFRFFPHFLFSAAAGVMDGKPCGFTVDSNPSVYRSPEEYSYKEETEKIDIFSMGNIFYTLLADITISLGTVWKSKLCNK